MQIFAPVRLTHSCIATSSPCSRRNSFSYSFVFIRFGTSAADPFPARLLSFRGLNCSSFRRDPGARPDRGDRGSDIDALARRAVPPTDPLVALDHDGRDQRQPEAGEPLGTG